MSFVTRKASIKTAALIGIGLAMQAAVACPCVVMAIDVTAKESTYTLAREELARLRASSPGLKVGVLLFDTVINRVIPISEKSVDFELPESSWQQPGVSESQGYSNFTIAIERSIDLFKQGGSDGNGSRKILLAGIGKVNTGDPALDQQFEQWYEKVLAPRLQKQAIELVSVDTSLQKKIVSSPVAARQTASPLAEAKPKVGKSPSSGEAPFQESPIDAVTGGLSTWKRNILWPLLILGVFLIVAFLIIFLRQRRPKSTALSVSPLPAQDVAATAERETVADPVVPVKTMVRPAATVETESDILKPESTVLRNSADLTAIPPGVTRLNEGIAPKKHENQSLPENSEDNGATKIRPKGN